MKDQFPYLTETTGFEKQRQKNVIIQLESSRDVVGSLTITCG